MSVRKKVQDLVESRAAEVIERATQPGGVIDQAQVLASLGAALREGVADELAQRDPRQLLTPGKLPGPVGTLVNSVVARRSDGQLVVCLGAGGEVRRWELEQQVRAEVAAARGSRKVEPPWSPAVAPPRVVQPVDSQATVAALKGRARSLGITVPRRIKKAALIALIEAAD
jgi:hypothetical protein